MYRDKIIGVVIPALNEQRLIERVITTIPDYVDRIIVIDDGSQDETVSIVESHQRNAPERIVLLCHEENQGVGGAIATGYEWCRDHEIDVAVVMAGDAQMDPDDLEKLLDPVVADEVDYAKGNRLFTGLAWQRIPKWRYLGNSSLSMLTKIASGYWHVADSQCGYTAVNADTLHLIDWSAMYKRYGQPNDLLVRLNVSQPPGSGCSGIAYLQYRRNVGYPAVPHDPQALVLVAASVRLEDAAQIRDSRLSSAGAVLRHGILSADMQCFDVHADGLRMGQCRDHAAAQQLDVRVHIGHRRSAYALRHVV